MKAQEMAMLLMFENKVILFSVRMEPSKELLESHTQST